MQFKVCKVLTFLLFNDKGHPLAASFLPRKELYKERRNQPPFLTQTEAHLFLWASRELKSKINFDFMHFLSNTKKKIRGSFWWHFSVLLWEFCQNLWLSPSMTTNSTERSCTFQKPFDKWLSDETETLKRGFSTGPQAFLILECRDKQPLSIVYVNHVCFYLLVILWESSLRSKFKSFGEIEAHPLFWHPLCLITLQSCINSPSICTL